MNKPDTVLSLEEHLPRPMQGFLAMVDDEVTKTSDRSEKLRLLNLAINKAQTRANRFAAWAVRPGNAPCPEKFHVHADDFLNVIQALENRRCAIEKQIRSEIAEHENAPLETFQALGDVARGIHRGLNGYNRPERGLDAGNRLTASDYGVGRYGRS